MAAVALVASAHSAAKSPPLHDAVAGAIWMSFSAVRVPGAGVVGAAEADGAGAAGALGCCDTLRVEDCGSSQSGRGAEMAHRARALVRRAFLKNILRIGMLRIDSIGV